MIKRKCLKEESSLVWNERIEERRLQLLKKRLLLKEQILEEIRESDEELILSGGKKKKNLEKTITKFVKKHRLLPLMQEEYLLPNDELTFGTDQQMLKLVFDKNNWNENDWYLVYRPQGRRVLVISNNVHTFVVEMKTKENNLFLKKYVSVLQSIGGKSQSFTILDAILHETNEEKKIYVLDLIAWNGHYFNTNPAEFRFYWLTQKWKEELNDNMYTKDQNVIDIVLCERVPLNNFFASVDIYHPNYETDGLYLYHKEGDYVNEISPFLLVFRTFNNCMYLKDLIQSGVYTFNSIYERHDSLASIKIGQLEIMVPQVLPHIETKSVVKVKLRLKQNGMLDEDIQYDNFEIISIEEDPLFKVIGRIEERESYCDSFGKLLFYLSIQNLQNDGMIL